jgi:predicted metalloprotease with PDZ domain
MARSCLPSLAVLVLLVAPRAAPAQSLPPVVTLSVDATDAPRKLLHTRETIAVKEGPLTLLYPQWIPGEHGPTGPVTDVVSLHINAGGAPLPWRRDLQNMYALHCEVPAGVSALEVVFDFVLPPVAEGFSSGASSTADLLVLSWNQVVLYPDSPRPDELSVAPSLKLPEGWKHATALATADASPVSIRFEPVSLTKLVDSPVAAGAHLRSVDLTPPGGPRCTLNLVADSEAALALDAAQEAAFRRLAAEAIALFGAHHFDHYDFLFTLSDGVAHFGLEHHESSDDRLAERTLIDDDLRLRSAGLLPHEMVHSWNGKYRRPAGLATGDFSTPMRDDLLWVYEGLTEYLGNVLTARSGLRTPAEYRDNLALVAASLDQRPGREWRPLQDANDEAQLLYSARSDWGALRRDVDFYDEGDLIWLEADVKIRGLTAGSRSLDDFCRAFHGGPSGPPAVAPYTFEDVVAALDRVAPYDWRGFFTTRLTSLSPRAPLGGIEGAGWKLVYSDSPSPLQLAIDRSRKQVDLRYSLGLMLTSDGAVQDVLPGSPAYTAGIGPGMRLIAVDSRTFSEERLGDALKAAVDGRNPIELLVANGDVFSTRAVEFHGGARYPHLERDPSRPDLLSAIVAPLTTQP